MTEIIGFLAGIFVAASLLPQLIKSIKTKSTKDLSIGLMVLNCTGQILWIAYGVLIQSYALMVMSIITLIFSGSLLVTKILYK